MKLAFLAAAWLAGTMLGLDVDPPLLPVGLLMLAILLLALLSRAVHRPVWPALLAGVLLLGLLRVEAVPGAAAPSLLRDDGPDGIGWAYIRLPGAHCPAHQVPL